MPVARPWAWPLVGPYWAGLRLKDGLRAAGILPARRLGWPVLSVGSLSAGGAGKTPVVIALAELLGSAGHSVDVLSRGYGRKGRAPERVDPEAPHAAAQFGDEPVLIARRTGAPVWVSANRFEAGIRAEKAGSAWIRMHLLDDGFQHRQLARAIDIVLLTAEDMSDALLPAGNRREPLDALRRAHVVVLREDEAAMVLPRVKLMVQSDTEIWIIRRSLALPTVVTNAGHPVVAFCGIARPAGFFGMLRGRGLTLAAEIAFPDHHRYTSGDVSRIAGSCHLDGCRFITTEKDAVKLGPELRQTLDSAGGLFIATLDAVFLDPEHVVRTIEERLG